MLDLNGRILAPAGIIWSVVILSATLSEHEASMLSVRGEVFGYDLMLGPLRISMLSISSTGAGAITILSLIRNFSGSSISTASPSTLGSVNTPLIAETAAVSGDTRYI